MDDSSQNKKIELSWDTYSLTIISIFIVCGIFQWNFLPRFIDIYYHLSVMLGFNQAGGFFTREFLEYAPVGRPHIYPPLLHIPMLLFYKLGFSKIFIARLFDFAIYPLTLAVIWQVIRNVFSPRLAFFVILAWVSCYSLSLAISNLMPFSLALLLALLAFLCIEKNKVFCAGLLLGLSFYTHALMPWLAVLCFFLYAALNPDRRRQSFKACLSGILLGLPMLWYQYQNRMYFKLAASSPASIIEINILVYLLSLIGIVAALRNKGNNYFFICLILAMLPLNFTHKTRYLSGHGLTGFIFAGGLAIDYFYQKMVLQKFGITRLLVFMLIILSSLLVFNPTLYVDNSRRQIFVRLFNPVSLNLLSPNKRYVYENELSIYNQKSMDDIVKVIERNSAKDDIIYSNLNYHAGLLSVFSERATSQAMMREVRPYSAFDPVSAARIIIWFKEANSVFPQKLTDLISRYKLSKLEETDSAYIYLNPSGYAKSKVSKAILPAPVLFFSLFVIAGLVIWGFSKP